jgi:hypothetical protein
MFLTNRTKTQNKKQSFVFSGTTSFGPAVSLESTGITITLCSLISIIHILSYHAAYVRTNKEVKDEIKKWAVWLCSQLHLGGIRFDAVKHFSEDFLIELVEHLTIKVHENLFFVGMLPHAQGSSYGR